MIRPSLDVSDVQAVENVSTVMSNILRTQAKLDQTFDKLGALGTDEAQKPYTLFG